MMNKLNSSSKMYFYSKLKRSYLSWKLFAVVPRSDVISELRQRVAVDTLMTSHYSGDVTWIRTEVSVVGRIDAIRQKNASKSIFLTMFKMPTWKKPGLGYNALFERKTPSRQCATAENTRDKEECAGTLLLYNFLNEISIIEGNPQTLPQIRIDDVEAEGCLNVTAIICPNLHASL
jgi:hypothetical protein